MRRPLTLLPFAEGTTQPPNLRKRFGAIALIKMLSLVAVSLSSTGCLLTPIKDSEHPLMGGVKAVDAVTHKPILDAQVVFFAQRREPYLPDAQPGRKKTPYVVVAPLDQSALITLDKWDVSVYPLFAFGTVYYEKDAWVYKRGYVPVFFPSWRSYPDPTATAQMQPCEGSKSEAILFELLSKDIPRRDWRDAAEAEIRKHLR
jgi:hypothetical protein